jgi:sigma-E factor negative regulatory protein RseC
MLFETGVVVRSEGNAVWIKTLRKTTCGSCQARHGCGQNLLQRIMPPAADIRARLPTRADNVYSSVDNLKPGDEVEIAIQEGAVIAASLLAYGLPLATLILGVVLAESFVLADPIQMLLGILGLATGLWISRLVLFSQFKPAYFEPLVVQSLSGATPVIGRG